jgi:hypothetical protein
MKKRIDQALTKLVDAAFAQASQEVIERAENSGTPVIICVNDEVTAVEPQAARDGLPTRLGVVPAP